jgi:lipopolysaccharide biosynthesis glycosyltransferase
MPDNENIQQTTPSQIATPPIGTLASVPIAAPKSRYDCQIFLSYHRPAQPLVNEYLFPVQVGAARSNLSFCELRDDTGDDQISAKNDTYCELTAQYWAWKNCTAERIGFMHYRRHLIFDTTHEQKEDIYGVVYYRQLDEDYVRNARLDNASIRAILDCYDLVLPRKWDVRNGGSKSLYDHYKSSSKFLHIKDYDIALEILKQKYPEYAETADTYNAGTHGYFTNMFVMRRPLFDKYSEWLFDILFETEKRIDISSYGIEERRVFGYISEWLFGIFIMHHIISENIKFIELQRTFVRSTAKQSATPIDIFGTCVSSDIFYHPRFQQCTEMAGLVRLGNYSSRPSILSFAQPSWNLRIEDLHFENNAQRLTLDEIFNKRFLRTIEKKHSEFLLIDAANERRDLFCVAGAVIDRFDEVEASGFLDGKDFEVRLRNDWIGENFSSFRDAVRRCCEHLKRFYPVENIMINRCYLVDFYRKRNGTVEKFDKGECDYNHYSNVLLELTYNLLIENLKGCAIFEMPPETLADEDSPWGHNGAHYTIEFSENLHKRISEHIASIRRAQRERHERGKLDIEQAKHIANERELERARKNAASKERELSALAISPAFNKSCVPVCVAFNDAFAPYAAACIQSIIAHISPQNNYDIVVLQSDVSAENKKRISSMSDGRKNITIRFVDTTPFFDGLPLPVHMHFGREIYYRLRIPTIFQKYGKIIYLDVDTIVLRDVAELTMFDLRQNYFAAVPDYVMKGFRKLKIGSLREAGGQEADSYLREYVGIKKPENYFQSGIMMFNINALRRENVEERLIKLLNGKVFWFPDQDIMNLVAEGRVHFLDYRWNVLHGNGDVEAFYVQLPPDIFDKYVESRRDPFIIHFAGERKPWKVFDIDYADRFWEFAQQTPWRKEMRKLRDDLVKARQNEQRSPGEQLARYHRISKDPFIATYRKLRRTFGAWNFDTTNGTTEQRNAVHHQINKDPLITLYRKIRRTFGLWNY